MFLCYAYLQWNPEIFLGNLGVILMIILENGGVGLKVGKHTLDEKSCLEMGSYDTP